MGLYIELFKFKKNFMSEQFIYFLHCEQPTTCTGHLAAHGLCSLVGGSCVDMLL
jgi:hypothetical protein